MTSEARTYSPYPHTSVKKRGIFPSVSRAPATKLSLQLPRRVPPYSFPYFSIKFLLLNSYAESPHTYSHTYPKLPPFPPYSFPHLSMNFRCLNSYVESPYTYPHTYHNYHRSLPPKSTPYIKPTIVLLSCNLPPLPPSWSIASPPPPQYPYQYSGGTLPHYLHYLGGLPLGPRPIPRPTCLDHTMRSASTRSCTA